jgi:hypothetical protein
MSQLNVGKLNVTGSGVKFPSYTTATLPSGELGLTVWDSTVALLKIYNGTSWQAVPGEIPHPVGQQVFTYTGSDQSFTVPTDVTRIKVKVWGGGGGGGGTSGWSDGGRGGGAGYAEGNLNVSPGTVYTVVVGQAGIQRSPTPTYGGGGRARNTWGPASGGGLSGFFSGGTQVFSGASPQTGAQGRSLVVAGGGGGGGATRNPNSTNGGGGGGTSGNNGTANYGGNNGTGGTQLAAGSSNCSTAQGPLRGANCTASYGSGGGSGYYGGGAGCYQEPLDMGGGGGGSGYIAGTVLSGVLTVGINGSSSGGNAGNAADTDANGAGTGGNTDTTGANGRVVIKWPY